MEKGLPPHSLKVVTVSVAGRGWAWLGVAGRGWAWLGVAGGETAYLPQELRQAQQLPSEHTDADEDGGHLPQGAALLLGRDLAQVHGERAEGDACGASRAAVRAPSAPRAQHSAHHAESNTWLPYKEAVRGLRPADQGEKALWGGGRAGAMP